MFRQRLWMVGVVYWVGLFSMLPAAQILIDGGSLKWLAVWAVAHLIADTSVSVGLHRYFSHASFKTSRPWHYFLVLISTFIFRGPIITWAAYHASKHTVASKIIRPQWTDSLSHLLHKVESLSTASSQLTRLTEDRLVVLVDKFGLLVVGALSAALYGLGVATDTGVYPLLFGYLAPLGTRRMWDLVRELTVRVDDIATRHGVFFTHGSADSSEWRHLSKPTDPRIRSKWYYPDFGWYFIQLIRK